MNGQRTPIKPTPHAGVICHGGHGHGIPACGKVDLTYDQYMDQVMRPDSLWYCPVCRGSAEFDDHRYDELHPNPED